MKRRILTRTQKQYLLAATLSVLVIAVGLGIAYKVNAEQLDNQYRGKIDLLEGKLKESTKTVYVAVTDIPAGDQIGLDNLKLKEIASSQPTEHFISKEDLGKLTLVSLEAGQPVTKNVIAPELEKGLREAEYTAIRLSSNLVENDFVDVRIQFPNGENYVVLSKKAIKAPMLENSSCFLWVNEDEILHMSAAMVDAYLHEGTILYTAKYLDDGQEASIATYQANEDVMLEIANNPNIVEEAARELNLTLRRVLEEHLTAFEGKRDGTDLEESAYEGNEVEESTYQETYEDEEVYYVD